MEGRKPKKMNATKSKTKRTPSKTATPKRKTIGRTTKTERSTAKTTANKTTKKVVKSSANRKRTSTARVATAPVVDSITKLPPARVSGLTQPLTVQALPSNMLKSTAYVHPWSLRHNVVVIVALTLVAIIAMVAIASFTQSTLSDIESLNTPSATLMKPTATETRFFTTLAGEIKLTLPATWTVTNHTDDTISYTHTTLANTNMTVRVIVNEETDAASWFEANTPDYEQPTVVESTEEVAALRGLSAHATNADGVAMQLLYLPIQKNLRERYIVAIEAQTPTDSTLAVTEALDEMVANFQVE